MFPCCVVSFRLVSFRRCGTVRTVSCHLVLSHRVGWYRLVSAHLIGVMWGGAMCCHVVSSYLVTVVWCRMVMVWCVLSHITYCGTRAVSSPLVSLHLVMGVVSYHHRSIGMVVVSCALVWCDVVWCSHLIPSPLTTPPPRCNVVRCL